MILPPGSAAVNPTVAPRIGLPSVVTVAEILLAFPAKMAGPGAIVTFGGADSAIPTAGKSTTAVAASTAKAHLRLRRLFVHLPAAASRALKANTGSGPPSRRAADMTR